MKFVWFGILTDVGEVMTHLPPQGYARFHGVDRYLLAGLGVG